MSNQPIPVELHSHTTFSDGELEPEALAKKLGKAQVKVWSLTDHDTCAGCERAWASAKNLGIAFVNGIEISAWDGVSVHVLGYGVAPKQMESFSARRVELRTERMREMVANLNRQGVSVDYMRVAEIAGEGTIGRPHLATALIEAGHVESIPEAFSRLIGSRCPAYVSSNWPTVEQAIEIIHDAEGVAVLAHPGIYGRDARIPAWVDHGLDGIEVGHPRHDGEAQLRYARYARELNVLQTASTDYHGPSSAVFPLGKTYVQNAAFELMCDLAVKE